MTSSDSRALAFSIFANETSTTAEKIGEVPWSKVVEEHKRRRIRPDKSGIMLGGYNLVGTRANDSVPFRSLIQLDIDTEGIKDKATGRIVRVTRSAAPLDKIRSAIAEYEWCAPSSHWHEPGRGVIKYRIVVLPDRDILREEWEPLLEALDERLEGALDRSAWQWSQAFYLPSCPAENEGDAFFQHNEGAPLPVDEFVRRGREIMAARNPARLATTKALSGGAAPSAETMRAMLEYLAARNYFEGRKPWIGAGMALKVAYGDEVGLDLWSFTHIDDRAREDAAGQWASFAAEPQPGHVTIATMIKAAKDTGFEGFARISQRTDGPEHDVAAGYVSYSPFTMDPDDGLTKEVIGRSKNAPPVPVWISSPFEVLGRYRDPRGRGWGKLLQFRDADGCIHMHHVSDGVLQGDPAGLCADLADNGLRINRSQQRELAEYLTGVSVGERVTIVSQTGWQEVGGQRVFVLPDETIAADMSERVVLDAAARGPYEARGSLEDWKRGVGALTAGHALPVFMVSAALAGPLAHLVGAEGGGVHVYGQSSIGKSAMLAAGASVWGRGGTPGYVRSWRATANGLEGAAAGATDTCLVLDELGVGNPREVADSIYALANGSGKQRARRDGSLQDPRAWRVFVLSSGEVPIEGKIAEDFGRKTRAGQTVRLIDIPADCGLGFGAFDHAGECNDAGKLADAIKEAARTNYGVAGPEFVRRLMGIGLDRVAAEARKMIVNFVDKFVPPGAAEQISRVAKKFALIGIAGALATRGGVTPWAEGEAQRAARRMFERWLETRGGANSHEERQAVEQVRRLILQHGDSRFECADGSAAAVRDRLGWRRGEGAQREWWVPAEIWKAEFCAGLDSVFVARTLASRGMIRRQADRKNLACTVTPKGGQKMRCYVLTAAILEGEEG